MTQGMQIFNDSGTILLNELYKNMALRVQGTVTIGATGVARITIVGLTSPVVAVRCSTNLAYAQVSVATGLQIRSVPGSVVSYYVFDVPISAGLNQGLQVWNAAGELCFDSGRNNLRVVDAVIGPDIRSMVGTYTFPAGKQYAALFTSRAMRRDYDGIVSNCPKDQMKYRRYRWDAATKINGSTVVLDFWKWTDETSYGECTNREPKLFDSYPCALVIMDVSGY